MGIVSLKNKIRKRITQDTFKTDYSEIGTFIKEQRKKRQLTQDVISYGICSISYLSKIENNQIVPNEFFVREIMERLEVSEEFLVKNLEDRHFLELMIHHYFFEDWNLLKEVYDEIKAIEHNLIINIAKFGYKIVSKEPITYKELMLLENLVMNMDDYELKSYLLFSALYFIRESDYKTALEILKLSEDISFSNDYIDALLQEQIYYVKQRLLKKNCSQYHFDEAQRLFNKYHNPKRFMFLILNKIGFIISENPIYALSLLHTIKIEYLNKEHVDHYYYLKALTHKALLQNNEAILMLSNIPNDSNHGIKKLVLLYELCLCENDLVMIEEIQGLIENIPKDKMTKEEQVQYHFLQQANTEQKKEFLRDIAIPLAIRVDNFHLLKLYTNHVMDICIEHSRYKEATQHYKKYQKELQRIEKIFL